MSRLWPALRLLVVASLVMSTQSFLLIQGAFALNRDVIAERFCVNRDRPELECDGHCVLMERLGDHHKHGDESGTDALALALSVVSLVASPSPRLAPPPPSAPAFERADAGWAPPGHPAGVFRPPQGA